MNEQDGLFTLVERGLSNGEPVERTRLIGSISRALVADSPGYGLYDRALGAAYLQGLWEGLTNDQ